MWMDSGVLSVTTHGHLSMHKWYAHRLDNTQVKSSQRVQYSMMCYNILVLINQQRVFHEQGLTMGKAQFQFSLTA